MADVTPMWNYNSSSTPVRPADVGVSPFKLYGLDESRPDCIDISAGGDVTIQGRHVFVDGHLILTLAEGVRFDVLQNILTNQNEIKRALQERASLAATVGNLTRRIAAMERAAFESANRSWDLKKRVEELENAEVVEVEPEPIGDILREAKAKNSKRRLSRAEKKLDELAWKVFDLDHKLSDVGGFYVLQNIVEDILALHPDMKEDDLAVDIEDIVGSALRWCEKRSKWWRNTRCWVQPIGPYLIIKRNRFAFQVKEPPKEAILSV